jgi:5-(carboxyamino)imidazole ribonucleotide synthase
LQKERWGALAESLELVGLVALEMFVTRDGRVLANEMAPRPHNSGHWTIDACATSQFEQLVRAICGLPLGPVDVPGAVAHGEPDRRRGQATGSAT